MKMQKERKKEYPNLLDKIETGEKCVPKFTLLSDITSTFKPGSILSYNLMILNTNLS